MNAAALRGVVQRAYMLDLGEDAWLGGLAECAERSFGEGRGSVAAVLDARDPFDVRTRAVVGHGVPARGLAAFFEATVRSLSAAYVRRAVHDGAQANTNGWQEERPLRIWLDRFGSRDLLSIAGMDPSGVGVVLATNLKELRPLTPGRRRSLSQLGAHVCSALRLRDAADDAIDAAFDRDARPLNIHADAESARAQLHEAALALAAFGRRGGAGALDRFTSRVDARWSIVSKFEKDGEELLVARKNPPPSRPMPGLTRRECEIVSYLALGRSLKEVAYDLGIAASTVRVLAARAAKKSGARSTSELLARLLATTASATSTD